MDKAKSKIIVVLIIILLIITIIALILSSNTNNNNELNNANKPDNNSSSSGSSGSSGNEPNPSITKNDYIIIDNTDFWRVNDNRFYRESTFENIDSLFQTYENNIYKGEFYFKRLNVWNLFDKNNNYISYNGNLLAYTNNDLYLNIKNFQLTQIDINDLEDIKNEMKFNINMDDLNINEKAILDIDNNGIMDEIISVSNIVINESIDSENYFNLVYINYNNQRINLFKEEVKVEDLLVVPTYHIKYVLEINGIESIMISERYFSEGGINNVLFQKKNDNFQKVL